MLQQRLSFFVVCLVFLVGSISTDSQTHGAAQVTQAVPAPGKAHYIGFVPPAFTDPFYVEMADGVRSLAAQRGWKFEVYAPASAADVASQGIIVQQIIEKGVEAISASSVN